MRINIGGIEPPAPEDPNSPKKIPHWHPTPSDAALPGISVKEAVAAMKEFSDDEYVEPHIAISYLARADANWIEPFCAELATRSDDIKERCWKFLGDFGAGASTLVELAANKNYEGLKAELPKGEVIAAKLFGASG